MKRRLLVFLGLLVPIGLLLLFRTPVRELTPEALAEARARWAARGPSDYSYRLAVTGAREGVHEIEVHDGKVVTMRTDGRLVPPRVWPYWDVPGLFRFIDEEISQRRPGAEGPFLTAEFDEVTGLPRRFLRQGASGAGTMEWKVTEFRPGE